MYTDVSKSCTRTLSRFGTVGASGGGCPASVTKVIPAEGPVSMMNEDPWIAWKDKPKKNKQSIK